MITVTQAYKFEELTHDAQQRAINSLCDINVDHDWWDYIYDDAERAGIKITSFGLDRNRHATSKIESPAETARLILEQHGDTCETYKTAQAWLKEYTPVSEYHDRLEAIAYNARGRFCTYNKLIQTQEIIADLNDDFSKEITEDYSIILQHSILFVLIESFDFLIDQQLIV